MSLKNAIYHSLLSTNIDIDEIIKEMKKQKVKRIRYKDFEIELK